MDVIIIGAGMGGLSAAVGLAARGARVTLLEKNERVGGKLNLWEQDGFRFDTGPHVLTMRWALDEVFAQAGRSLDDFAELTPLPTICRYHFPDGDTLDAPGDTLDAPGDTLDAPGDTLDAPGDTLDAPGDTLDAAQAIARFAPGEEVGFRRFLEYAQRVSEATTDPFLRQDFGASVRGIPSRAQWGHLAAFLALKPWRSLRDVVREHFQDPRLRQVFELYALYSGSHPARSSGIFATVADVQWRQGTYYVQGGLYKLASALRTVAADWGVQIRTEASVTEILVKGGRARGVALQNGERLWADAVVCNVDCLTALRSLVPSEKRHHWTDRRVEAIEPSTSAFLLLLGVRGTYRQLAHHNSFLAADLDAEFESIFDRHRPAEDPTVGVACQTVTDPTKAPPGCSNLFVMTNPPALAGAAARTSPTPSFVRRGERDAGPTPSPYEGEGWGGTLLGTGRAGNSFDWHTQARQYREIVLQKLERMGMKGLRQNILVEQMWTPLDLESRYGAHRGAIYGLSSNGWRQAFLRPPQVSPDVKGLYFVGGSTHPGGGLPLCALSGTNVARKILGEEPILKGPYSMGGSER